MKRGGFFTLVILFIVQAASLSAQQPVNKKDLAGSWLGRISTGAATLRVVFNLKLNENDSLSATMDSPDQGANNISLGKVKVKADSLIIDAPLLLGNYKGVVKNDTSITGIWTQRGYTVPLDLKRLRSKLVINRPQEPKPPFTYSSEDVSIPNKRFNIFLAGTLTMPQGNGPFPAVIMITGSGAQNRDEAIMGHKPFLVIADWLTRNGIAVLRYDDRGVGKSQGNYATATSADLATDAEAAYLFLKDNPKINKSAIGLMGHSEGGLIAPIMSSTNPATGFIVSLAGPGVIGEQVLLRQQSDLLRLSGASEQDIKEKADLYKKLFSIIKKEKDNVKAEVEVFKTFSKFLEGKNLTPDEFDKQINLLKATFGASTYPWFRYFISTDPAAFWKKVKCPVLALNGEKDTQVAADVNLPAIENAVKSGGNNSIKAVKFPGLNHLFQHCTTGLPNEYNQIEETFSPEVLKVISDWITGLKVSR